jgi:hypothetical protein
MAFSVVRCFRLCCCSSVTTPSPDYLSTDPGLGRMDLLNSKSSRWVDWKRRRASYRRFNKSSCSLLKKRKESNESTSGLVHAFPFLSPRKHEEQKRRGRHELPHGSNGDGITTPRLRPKSLSPKSHAHPARGWWRLTHIYRRHIREVKGENEVIVEWDQDDERTRWTTPRISDLDLSLSWNPNSPDVNSKALIAACEKSC